MKKMYLLLGLALGTNLGHAQSTWTPISNPGPELWMENEAVGYAFQNFSVGSHGSRFVLSKSDNALHNFSSLWDLTGDFGCYRMDEIFFCSPDTGFVAVTCQGINTIYKTVDGGQNFQGLSFGTPYGLSMFWLNEELGYAAFGLGGVNASRVLRYENGTATEVFSTFEYLLTKDNYSHPGVHTQLHFTTDSTGFILTEDTTGQGVILRTTDTGLSWTELYSSPASLRDIHFTSDVVAYVCGTGGLVLKSTDAGRTWSSIVQPYNVDLNGIWSRGDTLLFAGTEGMLLQSPDAGGQWSQENFGDTLDLLQVRRWESGRTYLHAADGQVYVNFPTVSQTPRTAIQHLKVGPNPTTDRLQLWTQEARLGNYTVRVYDALGRVHISKQNVEELYLGDLQPGIYTV